MVVRQAFYLFLCFVSSRQSAGLGVATDIRYSWHPQIIGNDHLTGSLILVALTAGFGSLALFSLLHSIRDLRSGATSFFLTVSGSSARGEGEGGYSSVFTDTRLTPALHGAPCDHLVLPRGDLLGCRAPPFLARLAAAQVRSGVRPRHHRMAPVPCRYTVCDHRLVQAETLPGDNHCEEVLRGEKCFERLEGSRHSQVEVPVCVYDLYQSVPFYVGFNP